MPTTDAAEGAVPWRRVHPATPYLRGWLALVIIVAAVLRQWGDGLISGELMTDLGSRWPLALGISVAFLAVVVFFFWLSWRFTLYRVTHKHVQLRSGVVSRNQRQARLDRVQAVDIVRPLLPRLFGLSELRFEVADAGESALKLAYLKAADAEALRHEILERAAGAKADAAEETPAPPGTPSPAAPGTPSLESPALAPSPSAASPRAAAWARGMAEDFRGEDPRGRFAGGTADERVLASVPGSRLVGATVLGMLPVLVLSGVGLFGASLAGPGVLIGVLIPVGLGLLGSVWGSINGQFGFRAAVADDGLRLRHGLTDSQHRTVPPGRVQAVEISQPLLWRPFGWFRIRANIAGYGASQQDGNEVRSVVLPVGSLADVQAILPVVLPDPGVADPWSLLMDGLTGRGGDGFVTSPRSARFFSPLAWRRQGYVVTASAVAIRTGALTRRLAYVPHARTQGILTRSGPLDRRAGLADVLLATTKGPVSTRIPQMAMVDALGLSLGQVERAVAAARRDDSNHWLATSREQA